MSGCLRGVTRLQVRPGSHSRLARGSILWALTLTCAMHLDLLYRGRMAFALPGGGSRPPPLEGYREGGGGPGQDSFGGYPKRPSTWGKQGWSSILCCGNKPGVRHGMTPFSTIQPPLVVSNKGNPHVHLSHNQDEGPTTNSCGGLLKS